MGSVLVLVWSIGALYSASKVISSTNPVISVFWLVIAFTNASLLLLMLGIEFLPMLFLIVYVGAILILFLFVVMLLNIKLVELTENTTRYLPIAVIIGLIFLYEIYLVFTSIRFDSGVSWEEMSFTSVLKLSNIEQLGAILYTDYWLYFLVSSLVLFVGMIGAITLCLYHEEGVKRQDLFAQVSTDYSKTLSKFN